MTLKRNLLLCARLTMFRILWGGGGEVARNTFGFRRHYMRSSIAMAVCSSFSKVSFICLDRDGDREISIPVKRLH